MSALKSLLPRLAAIKAQAEQATPGPWDRITDICDCSDGMCSHGEFAYAIHGPNDRIVDDLGVKDSMANGALIAAARTDVPALVEALEEARALLDVLADDAVRALAAPHVYKALDIVDGMIHRIREALGQ